MSRTPVDGVVEVKYWVYMAAAMVECLDQIIRGQQAEKIPINVLHGARLFFKIALGQETHTHFDNLLARTNAHIMAWEILNDCPLLQAHTREEADRHFRRFGEFLEGLKQQPAVPLDDTDKKTATDLRDFFAALLRKDAKESRF